MEMILTGIENKNEYYTNHYFTSIFQDNAEDTIKKWKQKEKQEEIHLPWKKLRDVRTQYYNIRDRYLRSKNEEASKPMIQELATLYLKALGYESINSVSEEVADGLNVPIFHEVTKANGAPLLWAFLSVVVERDDDILQGYIFEKSDDEDENGASVDVVNDDILAKLFFAGEEAPRFILLFGINQIALIDRNKWNEKRYLQFMMYDETNAQKAGFIERCTMFPDDLSKFVYSGPHISIGNPLFKTPRRVCKEKADFDRIYLDYIPEDYIQRTNYIVTHRTDDTIESQLTEWGTKYINEYRIATRKMLGLNQERTLMSAIIPPKTAHINGIFGMCFKESKDMIFVNGLMNSLPYDYFVRALGKSNFRNDTANMLPVPNSKYDAMIICRTMLLNCQTSFYKKLWEENYSPEFNNDRWLRKCKLLSRNVFVTLSHTLNTSLRLTDYERRELLRRLSLIFFPV